MHQITHAKGSHLPHRTSLCPFLLPCRCHNAQLLQHHFLPPRSLIASIPSPITFGSMPQSATAAMLATLSCCVGASMPSCYTYPLACVASHTNFQHNCYTLHTSSHSPPSPPPADATTPSCYSTISSPLALSSPPCLLQPLSLSSTGQLSWGSRSQRGLRSCGLGPPGSGSCRKVPTRRWQGRRKQRARRRPAARNDKGRRQWLEGQQGNRLRARHQHTRWMSTLPASLSMAEPLLVRPPLAHPTPAHFPPVQTPALRSPGAHPLPGHPPLVY